MIHSRRVAAGALAVVYLLIGACAVPIVWENKLTFVSSSSDAFVDLEQPYPENDWGLRIRLRTKTMTKVLYQFRGDTTLGFADATWSPDGKILGVIVCKGPHYRLAYDISRDTELPFAAAEQMIQNDIRSRYHLSPEQDAIKWACLSQDSDQAFLSKYPGAQYRQHF